MGLSQKEVFALFMASETGTAIIGRKTSGHPNPNLRCVSRAAADLLSAGGYGYQVREGSTRRLFLTELGREEARRRFVETRR